MRIASAGHARALAACILFAASPAREVVGQAAPVPSGPSTSVTAKPRVGAKGAIGGVLGSVGGSTDDESFERQTGWGDRYAVGYYVTPNFAVDVEVSTLRSQTQGVTQRDYYLLLGASLYPSLANGFHLSAAVGRGRAVSKDGNDEFEVAGMAFMVGAGVDIAVDKNIDVTPFARYMGTTGGGFRYSGRKLLDANINQFQVGLSLGWH
jgi:hypothetical protein